MHVGRSFDQVLDILLSESRSLKTLAYMSGYDPFEFYRSSDLSHLDLSRQDLTGLNFDNADLRGANLTGATYDVGAFNNCKLSVGAPVEVDEFDSYFPDLAEESINKLYVFMKFRKKIIDSIAQASGTSYGEFAEQATISASTLRKARRSEAVSVETGQAIWGAVKDLLARASSKGENGFLRQPSVCFLQLRPSGGFERIPREEFFKYLWMARRLYAFRKGRAYPPHMENWRDSPSMLNWYELFYFSGQSTEKQLREQAPPPELDFGLFARQREP